MIGEKLGRGGRRDDKQLNILLYSGTIRLVVTMIIITVILKRYNNVIKV